MKYLNIINLYSNERHRVLPPWVPIYLNIHRQCFVLHNMTKIPGFLFFLNNLNACIFLSVIDIYILTLSIHKTINVLCFLF